MDPRKRLSTISKLSKGVFNSGLVLEVSAVHSCDDDQAGVQDRLVLGLERHDTLIMILQHTYHDVAAPGEFRHDQMTAVEEHDTKAFLCVRVDRGQQTTVAHIGCEKHHGFPVRRLMYILPVKIIS